MSWVRVHLRLLIYSRVWLSVGYNRLIQQVLMTLNITSGTDNGTGDYTFTILNDMANSTYSIVATASQSSGNSPVISCNPTNDTNSTSVYRLQTGLTTNGSGGVYSDVDKLTYSAVFGDLA